MTPELHSRLQQIFERAVDLALAERALYLDQACSGDPELRERVDQLLEANGHGYSRRPCSCRSRPRRYGMPAMRPLL